MSLRPWLHPAMLVEYARTLRVRARRARHGHTRMAGDAAAIVRAGIERCWNGRTFTASPGHFDSFWTRDVCFSSTSLVALGQQDRLRASLDRAISIWRRRRSHVTTTIHYGDRPIDVFDYGIDSLPLLLAGLRAAGDPAVVNRHRGWLADEIRHFAELAIDPATGLVRADRRFSGHRDTVVNRSTAYGNAMAALLARTLAEMPAWDLPDPLARHYPDGDFGAVLVRHFWDGDHFRDSLAEPRSSGEANVWPFWTGAIADRTRLATALAYLRRHGYADPYPLRYEVARREHLEVWATRHLLPDYQGSTVWTSLGAIYLSLLRTVEPELAAAEITRYAALVERDGTFWEVLDPDTGRCWVSPRRLFIGEESMLWGAIFGAVLGDPAGPPLVLSGRPPPASAGPSS